MIHLRNNWKEIFADSVLETEKKKRENLSTSQRRANTRSIEKKYREKRFIQVWRPIYLLNVDLTDLTSS